MYPCLYSHIPRKSLFKHKSEQEKFKHKSDFFLNFISEVRLRRKHFLSLASPHRISTNEKISDL